MLPPGSKIPRLIQLYYFAKNPFKFFEKQRQQFGSAFTISLPFERPIVMISDPQLMAQLMNMESDDFPPYPANRWTTPLFGQESMLFKVGDSHRKHRKVMKPHLSNEASMRIRKTLNEQAVDYLKSQESNDVLAYEWSMKYMTKTSLANLLGLKDSEIVEQFDRTVLKARKRYSSFINLSMDAYACCEDYPKWLTMLAKLKQNHAKRNLIAEEFNSIITRHLDDAKKNNIDLSNTVLKKYVELNKADKLNKLELYASIMTLLIAGFDPAALITSRLLLVLSEQPDLQTKIRNELLEHGESLNLKACIKETMRLYPPLYAVTRTAQKQFRLGSYEIPAGTHLFGCIFLMHREEKYWPNPTEFDHKRFMRSESIPDIEQGFMPFGGNKRICPGRYYGDTAIESILSETLKSYQILRTTSSSSSEVINCFGPSLSCDENARVKLKLVN